MSLAPEASTVPADSVVTFNEVMYHPLGDDASLEWLEVRNQMAVDVDLSNWSIAGGVRYAFPPGTILPIGGYLVVAASPAAIQSASGLARVLGPWEGHLSNAGETLTLRNQNGRLMDQLTYGDGEPWPPGADGSGASLAKLRGISPSSPPSNWRASTQVGGTPGRSNFPTLDGEPPPVDVLLARDFAGRFSVLSSDDGGLPWQEAGFDDASWRVGTASVGYETAPAAGAPVPPARYYPFDGDLLDASGNGVDGVAVGSLFSTNIPPGSLAQRSADLPGTSQYIQIPDRVNPTAYTIACWIRPESIRTSSLVVRTDASGPTASFSHQLRLTGTGKLEHYLFDGAAQTLTGTNVLKRSVWYHVAITATGGGVMRVYFNGVQDGGARPVGTLWAGGDQWRIGSNYGSTAGFLDGQMSDLAIWHQELSAADIQRLAQGTSPSLLRGYAGVFLTDVGPELFNRNTSLRLRIPFTVGQGIAYDQLGLDVQYADGFIAWINGVEVARRNAPDGAAWNAAALASRDPARGVRLETIDVSSRTGLLRGGVNVLAVQALNATPGEPSFLFSARLRGREVSVETDRFPLVFSEVSAASESPFWVEVRNLGTQPLDLAGFSVFSSAGLGRVLESAVVPPGGRRVLSASDLGFAPAAGARLYLLSPGGLELLDTVIPGAFAQGRSDGDPRGEWLRPSEPTPGAPNQFRLHDEIVINEILYDHPPAFPKTGFPATTTNTLLLPFDAVWRYYPQAGDPGLGWSGPGFDDSAWSSGPAAFGVISGQPPIPIQTPINGAGRTTFYFRTGFVFPGSDAPFNLVLSSLLDDGAVFYLNGVEVHRQNLPSGTITNLTRAVTNISQVRFSPPVVIPTNALVAGTNLLAVELHQAATNSPADLLMATAIYLSREVAPGTPGEPYEPVDEEWVELYNRSDHAVDLSGWRLADGVDFVFPRSTRLEPDAYLVVARDAARLSAKHPGIVVLGDYSGRLSHTSDRVRLLDGVGNPANEVRYYNDRPWPPEAAGGGSSLELRDPRSDNRLPEAWGASDESGASPWRHYEITATAVEPVYGPSMVSYPFNDLRFCLLDTGEVLIDNVSVVEAPGVLNRELIQNANFETGIARWRVLGNHIHSRVDSDPDHAGNHALRLTATGAGTYLNNLVETTLRYGSNSAPVVAGREYRIAFDAKWISGTPLLRAELYYNRVAKTFRLDQPGAHGTPGRRNSRYVDNAGPTYRCLAVDPVVPRFKEPIHVSVQAADPDGIDQLTLFFSTNATPWRQVVMDSAAGGLYSATLPGVGTSLQIQFYVQGSDARGAVSTYPPGGTNSRAFIKVDNAPPLTRVPLVRVLTDPKEALGLMPLTNLLSDDALGCTIILGDRQAVYGGGIRLHGSMFSRQDQASAGFNVQFPADQPYKGVRTSLILRRRDFGEIVCRHMLANAPGLAGNYDEFVYLVSPLPGNAGIARVIFGNDDDIWLRSQFNGSVPTVFKMEGIREFQATASGAWDGYKVAMPIGWIQPFDIGDLGPDPEQYRWNTLLANHRDQDDYSGYVAMARAFSLRGPALQARVPEVMDVEEWARVFGLQALCGVGDVYNVVDAENPHNLGYLVRPDDGRVLALQNDWSFYFYNPTTEPLNGAKNLSRIFELPVYKRVYYGAMLHLINTVYSKTYMSRWLQHYGDLSGESYQSFGDYIVGRSAFAKAQFAKDIPVVPFEVTLGGGSPVTTNVPAITVAGRGWIDVYQVALGLGTNVPAPITIGWTDASHWQTQVALTPGTNDLVFTAYDRLGARIGSSSLQVVATYTERPQHDNLRVSEVMYHPPPPTAGEVEAGFTDADLFEFIEIANIGSAPVPLQGVQFTAGVKFTFTGAPLAQLESGQRAVVVRNLEAFRARYPDVTRIAGVYSGALDNGGEVLRMVDPYGVVIEEFRYGDSGDWPSRADGGGSSLERLVFTGDPASASSWQGSTAWGGTPAAAPDIVPSLEARVKGGQQLELRIVLPEGAIYRLEYRDQLDAGGWLPATVFAMSAVPRVETYQEALKPGVPSRYFRLAR